MKKLKEILKYILIFLITVFTLTTLLTLVAKIPRKYVEKNLKEATKYFEKNPNEVTRVKREKKYTYIHVYSDEVILNMIYCLDTNNPLKSILNSKYYSKFEEDGSNQKYLDLIENNYEPNQQYLRYWHGSILIIKPLLMIFTLEQIYKLNTVLLLALLATLIAILVKKKYYAIPIALVVGLIMTACWYVPTTFDYTWTYYIMLILSIICVLIEDKNKDNKNKKLYVLFLLSGIFTCFFDFLTTEILTILVPVTIVVSMRIKNKSLKDLKSELGFLIKSFTIWLLAYLFMWIAKWTLASIVLNINALDYVVEKAMIRINGQILDYPKWKIVLLAVKENFRALFPINYIQYEKMYLILIVVIILIGFIICIDRKNKDRRNYAILMFITGIVPYIRYMVLSNHSYRHVFFTLRSQLPTIMCIILIFIYSSNKEKLFAEINKTKKE